MKNNRNKKGFTLAEVLITLIVIGVISALTIPNILQNTQNAEFKTAFKKIYSDVAAITHRIAQDNGGTLAGVFTGTDVLERSDNIRNQYLNYMSYIKTCDASDVVDTYTSDSNGKWYVISNCWSKYIYSLNKSLLGATSPAFLSQVILTNGASLDFQSESVSCTATNLATNDNCGEIKVDVNGPKAPNQSGRDVFMILIPRDGNVVPAGHPRNDWNTNKCDPDGNDNYGYGGNSGYGWGCSAFVLQNKDY